MGWEEEMDLYDKIKYLHKMERKASRKRANRILDPKKAALEDLLESVRMHYELAGDR